MQHADRRDFLKLAGVAGVTFTAGLFAGRPASAQAGTDFHFVQFSDTHWGYSGAANPDAEHTLEKAVATVNGLASQPDFIVFTGDLTHTTADGKERRASTMPRSTRVKRFRSSSGPCTTPSTTRACISSCSTTSRIPPPSSVTTSSP